VKRARVYGGMHYRNSTEQGAKLGKKVVTNLKHHFFRRSHGGEDDGGNDDGGDDD